MKSQQIGMFPLSGRQVPEYESDNIREVFEGQYRIIYQINENNINVIAIIHRAMNIQENIPDK